MNTENSRPDLIRRFGNSLRTWRLHFGYSQEELAGRANLHRTYIADIERGARNLSLQSLEKLADALGIPIPALFSKPATAFQNAGNNALRPPAELPLEIILIEDALPATRAIVRALRQANLSNPVRILRSGPETVTYFFGKPGNKPPLPLPPLAILLPHKLSRLNSADLLKRLKRHQHTRTIPVVWLTDEHPLPTRKTHPARHADACIRLPFGLDQFIEGIAPLGIQLAFDRNHARSPGGESSSSKRL